MAAKVSKSGFELLVETNMQTGIPSIHLLASGKDHHFYVRAIFPNHPMPSEFIETTIAIENEIVKLAIDCESVMRCLKPLADARIVTLDDVQNACREKTFDQFVRNIERPWRWKQYLTQCVGKDEVPHILEYIYSRYSWWRMASNITGKFYIPANRKIRYSFEYCKGGVLWMYYTYCHQDEMRTLAIDLESGFSCLVVEFDIEIGTRICQFAPLFRRTEGILPWLEVSELDPTRRVRGKVLLFDSTLEKNGVEFSWKIKNEIAEQLLRALCTLKDEKIVHCAVFPSTIWLRYLRYRGQEVEAALFSFEYAFKVDSLPKTFPIPSLKWKSFMPDECLIPENPISHPFAIPIYQLGMCFKKLFGNAPTVAPIIEKMTDPKPELRLTAAQALAAFQEDRKDPETLSEETNSQ